MDFYLPHHRITLLEIVRRLLLTETLNQQSLREQIIHTKGI